MVLITVMNVSVAFENLPNGHFLEFGQEAQAANPNSIHIDMNTMSNVKSLIGTGWNYNGNAEACLYKVGNMRLNGPCSFDASLNIIDGIPTLTVSNVNCSIYTDYTNTRWDADGNSDRGVKCNLHVSIQILARDFRGDYNIIAANGLYLSETDVNSNIVCLNSANKSEAFDVTRKLSDGENIKINLEAKIYICDNSGNNGNIGTAPITFNYVWNTPPTLNMTSPSQNATLSKVNNCTPSIKVSDPNGDALTCQYYIDSVAKETQTAYNTASGQTVSFKTLDISSLSDGKHIFKFEVSDGIYDPVSQFVDVTVHNNPPIISSNTSFTSDNTSITISGSASDGISKEESLKYKYTVQDTAGKTVGDKVPNFISDKSLKIGSLLPNTLYNAKFEVMDEAGNTAKIEKQIYTKAQIPQVSVNKDSIKENSMELLINDSNPTTTQYQVMVGSSYVTETGALSSSPVWVKSTSKKITVTGLTQNMQYAIKAKAKNSEATGIETAFSTPITGTTLAQPPANINLVKGINFIKITWNAVSGASGYDIKVDGNVLNVGAALSYTHSGLQAESTHTYSVRTRNAGGTGQWSSPELDATILPNPPGTPKITDTNTKTTQTTITISWDAVAKATSYEIEADGKNIGTDSKTTYTDEGLSPDSLHKYRVRSKNAGGESEWSAVTDISTLPIPPEIPAKFKGIPTVKSITLSWEAAERAEGYYIEMDGSIREVKLVTSYIFDGLSANSSHTYRIRAWNRGGKSDWSSYQTITTWPEIPPTPNNIMATAETDAITVTWYSSAYAESYDLQVDEKETVNVKETSYTNKGLLPGTKHTYKIRAKNISGEGLWSKLVEISTLPQENTTTNKSAILANIAAVVTNKSVTLAWQAVTSNAQYEVEVDGVVSDNGKETVYSHTGLEPVSFHTYRIRTKDANGNGQWCAVLALSTLPNLPGAPSNVNAIASNTQIKLSWTKEESIAYEVEVDGEVVNAGEAASYINNGLKPGTAHTYRVRGKNITGVTAWSNSITKSTTSPSYEVKCTKDIEFDFSLLASNVQDFGGINFVVTYNSKELEVEDLCEFTAGKDTTTNGKIPGTNISVKCTEGRLEFTVDESITAGTTWSGEITTIVFKPKIDGKASINYSIE